MRRWFVGDVEINYSLNTGNFWTIFQQISQNFTRCQTNQVSGNPNTRPPLQNTYRLWRRITSLLKIGCSNKILLPNLFLSKYYYFKTQYHLPTKNRKSDF